MRSLLQETLAECIILEGCDVQERCSHSLRECDFDPWHEDRNLNLEEVKSSWSRRSHV